MRIAVFLFVLVASASLLPAVAHAQPPAQLSPPVELPPEFPGSVSGRIVIEGQQPPVPYQDGVAAISVDVPQPVTTLAITNLAPGYVTGPRQPDEQGRFTVSGLADGEFFLLLPRGWEVVHPPGEDVLFGENSAEAFTFPGVADGATGRIAAGLAVVATLLLAGGVALRARSGRPS